MRALLILLVAAVASASDIKKVLETKQVSYHSKPDNAYALDQLHGTGSYTNTAVYHGQYNGKCGNDGFYYNDHSSFVMCSNGNAYIQKCAHGSKNSANNYQYGSSYNYRDFCDVNLVDDGYTLKHGAYNTGYHGNGAASYGQNHGYGLNIGYHGNGAASHGQNFGYGLNTGYRGNGAASYGNNAGYGLNTGYGVSSGYGANIGYGLEAGYGLNTGHGANFGDVFGAGYNYNAPVQATGYNAHGYNNGFRGQNGYAGSTGYGEKSYGGIFQKTEYKTYGTANKAH